MGHVKTYLLLCCCLSLLLGLPACAATPQAEPTQASAQTPLAPAVAQPLVSTAAPDVTSLPAPTAEPDGLLIWVAEEEPVLSLVRSLLAEWSAQSGVPLAVLPKGADGLRADMLAARLAGEPLPDLLWGRGDDLALLHAQSLLQPVEGLALETLLPALISGARAENRLWGVPLAADDMLLLLYNRALIEQPPGTTDQLILSARQATGAGRYGLVAGWAEPRWLTAWLHGANGALLAADQQTPTLDSPAMQAALDLLRELRVAGPPAPSTYLEGRILFASGQVAMAIDGPWAIRVLRERAPDLDFGIAPMPVVPSTGRVASGPLSGIYLMYGADLSAERRADADTLAAFLLSPAIQGRLALGSTRLPALRELLASPELQADPLLGPAIQGAETAPGLPPTRAFRCAWGALALQLPPLLLDELSKEETLQRMQARALECLNETQSTAFELIYQVSVFPPARRES